MKNTWLSLQTHSSQSKILRVEFPGMRPEPKRHRSERRWRMKGFLQAHAPPVCTRAPRQPHCDALPTTRISPPTPTITAPPVWHIFCGGTHRLALWGPQNISCRKLCSGGGGGNFGSQTRIPVADIVPTLTGHWDIHIGSSDGYVINKIRNNKMGQNTWKNKNCKKTRGVIHDM